jgi:hypothetical protein
MRSGGSRLTLLQTFSGLSLVVIAARSASPISTIGST